MMSKLIINKSYEGWRILKREPATASGRVYYSCKCLGCDKTFRVAGDNITSGRSKRCGPCAGVERREANTQPTARDNPQLYALWWRLGSSKGTSWKTATDFIQWAKACGWKQGQRIVRISDRKKHGPKNSRFEIAERAVLKHIQTIATITGQSVGAVEQWAKTVTARYVSVRAHALSGANKRK